MDETSAPKGEIAMQPMTITHAVQTNSLRPCQQMGVLANLHTQNKMPMMPIPIVTELVFDASHA
jgi:hypothetical protein